MKKTPKSLKVEEHKNLKLLGVLLTIANQCIGIYMKLRSSH